MKTKKYMVSRAQPVFATKKSDMEFDLEDALDLAGTGKYQVFHCALMLSSLTAAILEIIGNAFILPAAACDLGLSDHLKGIVTSIPSIGIILTAPLWGRLADKYGRKPVLTGTCAGAGVTCFIATFMPNVLGYALCKFLGSLFLSCPTSLGFAYAGEVVPRKRRDLAVLIVNGLMSLFSSFSAILAWGILSSDWHFDIATLNFRPWRLLVAVYAAPLILTAVFMTQAVESPKFLMAKNKPDKALDVLRHIFVKNTGLTKEDFSVTSLKTSENRRDSLEGSEQALSPQPTDKSALDLLRAPHLKWLLLTGFLMFGLFSLLNGLYLFAPDTVNKIMSETNLENGTICVLMKQSANETISDTCVDSISHDSFLILVVMSVISGVIVTVASVCPVSKKTMLVGMFVFVGVTCLLSGVLTNKMVAGAAMSALQLTALGVGPLTAYAVHLFPTSLRATALGAVLMFGRVGAVVGANAAGYFLHVACASTFYGFTALLFVCAALSLLLPSDKPENDQSTTDQI